MVAASITVREATASQPAKRAIAKPTTVSPIVDRCQVPKYQIVWNLGAMVEDKEKFVAICNSPDVQAVCEAAGIKTFVKEDDPKEHFSAVVNAFSIVIAEQYLTAIMTRNFPEVRSAISNFQNIIDDPDVKNIIGKTGINFGDAPYDFSQILVSIVINDVFDKYASASVARNTENMAVEEARFRALAVCPLVSRTVREVARIEGSIDKMFLGDIMARYRTFSDPRVFTKKPTIVSEAA